MGDIGDTVSEECIPDLKQQLEYLGNLKLVWMATEQFFNQRKFGDETISTFTRFHTRQLNPSVPSFIEGKIVSYVLEDEIDYFQYGQFEEVEYYGY